jgi:hypothetical protein
MAINFTREDARELARGAYKKVMDGITVAHTFSTLDGSSTMVNLASPGVDPNALEVDFEAKASDGLMPVFIYYLLPEGMTAKTNSDYLLFETTLGSRRVVGFTAFPGTSADPTLRAYLRNACAAVYGAEVADKLLQYA